jgi:hypothetical protein
VPAAMRFCGASEQVAHIVIHSCGGLAEERADRSHFGASSRAGMAP